MKKNNLNHKKKINLFLSIMVFLILLNISISADDTPPENIFIVKGMLYIDNQPAEENITIILLFNDQDNESTETFAEDNGYNYNIYFQGHVNEEAEVHIIYDDKDLLPDQNKTITFENGNDGFTLYHLNFTINSTSNQPPDTPSDPTPTDEATNISVNQTLSWEGEDPDENDDVTYTLYLGTSASSLSIEKENTSSNNYKPDNLEEETSYYWQVISWDENDRSSNGPIWEFTTGKANIKPTADAGGPYTGVVGETISFDGSGSTDSDGNITIYEWDFGDGNTGSGETLNHQYNNDDSYTVTLTITDDDGATDIDTATVSIETGNKNPDSPSILANDSAFVNESISFIVSATDPDGDRVKFGFDWDGDKVIDNWSNLVNSGQTVTKSHKYEESFVYTVKVKTKDEHNKVSGFSEHLLSVTKNEKNKSTADSETGGDFPLIPLIILIIIVVVIFLLFYAYKMGALDALMQQFTKKSVNKPKKTKKSLSSFINIPKPIFKKKEKKSDTFKLRSTPTTSSTSPSNEYQRI